MGREIVTQQDADRAYEELVDKIDQALRDDGWLGHTEELEAWHLNAIASCIAKMLTGGKGDV